MWRKFLIESAKGIGLAGLCAGVFWLLSQHIRVEFNYAANLKGMAENPRYKKAFAGFEPAVEKDCRTYKYDHDVVVKVEGMPPNVTVTCPDGKSFIKVLQL